MRSPHVRTPSFFLRLPSMLGLWLALAVGCENTTPPKKDAGPPAYLSEARKLMDDGRVTEARAALERGSKGVETPSPELSRALLRTHLLEGDCEGGKPHADALQKSSSTQAEGRVFEGLIALCLGQRAAARALLRDEADALEPTLPAVVGYAASVQRSMDPVREAGTKISKWATLSRGKAPEATAARGGLAEMAGEGQDAEDAYDQAAEEEGADPALALPLSLGYAQRGMRPAAIALLRAALKASPNQRAVALKLAEFALDEDLGALASQALARIPEANEEATSRVLLRARAELASGHAEAAVKRLKAGQGRASQPAEQRALRTLLARAQREMRDTSGALATLESLRRAAPDDDAVRAQWLAGLVAAGEAARAESEADAWLAEAPGETQALLWKARALVAQRKQAAAAEVYVQLGKRDPSNVSAQIELGDALRASQLDEAALRAFEAALAREPSSGRALRGVLEILGRTVSPEEALKRATEHAEKVPRSAEAQLALASQLERAGRKGGARTAYLRATNLAPRDARGWAAFAEFVEREDGPTDALWMLQRAQEHAKPAYPLFATCAEMEARAGHPEKAIAQYEQLLAREPYAPGPRLSLAELLLKQPEPDLARARKLVDEAAALAPADAAVAGVRGWVLHLEGAHAEALPLLKSAAEATPDSPEAQYRLGTALLAAGKRREGRAALQRSGIQPPPRER